MGCLKGEEGEPRAFLKPPKQMKAEVSFLVEGAVLGGQASSRPHACPCPTVWDNLSLSLVCLANSYSSCKTLLRVTSPT